MTLRLLSLLYFLVVGAVAQTADVLIRGGNVVDGSGRDAVTADVVVAGDRIVYVGRNSATWKAKRVIDARGLAVVPGFIDPHTHTLADLSSPLKHGNEAYLMQGVTTVVTGNDGSSAKDIAGTLAKWREQGIGTNAALLLGQGTVRSQVLGMSEKAPDATQLEQMKELAAKDMDDGAIGMSTGLYYAPGSFSSSDEVIALAKVVAARHGIYDTHMRDESSYSIGLLGSVKETIRIGEEGGLPVQISHIKALGKDTWGMSGAVIQLVEKARKRGVQITASQYPYIASGTSVGASLLPRWAEAGGRAALLQRLKDDSLRPKLLSEMERNLDRRGGAKSILITGTKDAAIAGKTLAETATARHETPVQAAIEIIRNGDVAVASFNMNEDDLKNFMRQDWVMTCSDGSEGHPRKYGTFPRKLRKYVYDEHVISLPFAIRSSTSLVASALGLKDRGTLSSGFYADITVFDPNTVRDRATFEKPEELAAGMRYVLVNGVLTVDQGLRTTALPGRTLGH